VRESESDEAKGETDRKRCALEGTGEGLRRSRSTKAVESGLGRKRHFANLDDGRKGGEKEFRSLGPCEETGEGLDRPGGHEAKGFPKRRRRLIPA